MGNIFDYIEQLGNLSFVESPFNEVDNLILCQISYVGLDGIVPGIDEEGYITVEDASNAFFSMHSDEELLLSKSLLRTTPFTLKRMAKVDRFKNAKLSKFVSIIDAEELKQFAAMQIELEDGTVYVAFRGTDDNLISWEEAFNMCFETVPSQIDACEYLQNVMNNSDKDFRVGGHSKGGTLAIYSSMNCPDNLKKRIIEIYDNDGPGLSDVILASEEYASIVEKINRFTPEFSVIGTLFEHRGRHKIVANIGIGMKQHDCNNWIVSGNHFLYREDFTKKSSMYQKSVRRWLKSLKPDQRQAFVASIFGDFRDKGVLNVSDINDDYKNNVIKVVAMWSRLSGTAKYGFLVLALSFLSTFSNGFLDPLLTMMSNNH